MKCYAKKQAIVDKLYNRFKCHGVPQKVIADVIDLGLQAGLTLEQSEVGARMTIPEHFDFQEYYTIQDVMTVTGETEAEVLKRTEECKKNLIKQGKDSREYFPEVHVAPGLVN